MTTLSPCRHPRRRSSGSLIIALSLFFFFALGASGQDSWVVAMAQEHEGDEPVASGAATMAPRVEVVSERVVYASDGLEATGYLARPKDGEGRLPALIVIHEWWGLNDNIEAMTRRLAGEGYAALAVDLYGGEVAETRDEAMALMQGAMGDIAAGENNIRQAYAYLSETLDAPAVGVIGWCFGGGWSLGTARDLHGEIDAAVIYYGRLVTDPEQLEMITAPILGHFGSLDRGIPVSSVEAFESAMKELGKPVELHVYEGMDHAFANPSGTRYNAEAATEAWNRTVAFLARHLGQ